MPVKQAVLVLLCQGPLGGGNILDWKVFLVSSMDDGRPLLCGPIDGWPDSDVTHIKFSRNWAFVQSREDVDRLLSFND